MAGSPHVLRELQLLPLNPSPSNAQPVCIRRNSHPMHDNRSGYNAQTVGSEGDPISQCVHAGRACIDVNSSSESDDGFANEEAPFILRLSHIAKASPNGQKRASSNPKSGTMNSEPTKVSYFEHARTLDGVSLRAIEDEEGVLIVRKKLRLSKEDSAILEERFKEHSTLNPNQKIALAKQLNLQPRQVEVWFQNRRARTKLKQIEVDCEGLKKCCEMLSEENRRLQKEIVELRALTKASPGTTLTMCPSRECPVIVQATSNTASKLAPSISPPICLLTSSHHLLAPSL